MSRWQVGVVAVSAGWLFACTSASDSPRADAGSGGTSSTGGAAASGGAPASGGATASGGAGVSGSGGTPGGGGQTTGSGGQASGSGGMRDAGEPDVSASGGAPASGGTSGATGGAPVTPGTPGAYAPCGVPGPACPANEECRSLQSLGGSGGPVVINLGVACAADAGAYGCWCGVPCTSVADCPEPPGGVGEPFCSANFCRLLCEGDAGEGCPSGMRCTRFPLAPTAPSLCDWAP